jgi:DNA-binding transcriptional ArsR family regulator
METLFRKSLGDTPKIRVLEFLIEGRELDYSITDIAEGAEIGRTTLFRIWEDLIKNKIIISTRQIGNAKLYKLNRENPFVKKMIEIFDEIILKKKKVIAN